MYTKDTIDLFSREEIDRLKAVRGPLERVAFYAMEGCDEELSEVPASGLAMSTWGIGFFFRSGDLILSWESSWCGDPYRIAIVDAVAHLKIASLVVQDISALSPWCELVGIELTSFQPLTYESNYHQHPTTETWHPVLWGVLLNFGGVEILVAAAGHNDPYDPGPCGDSVVVAFTPETVRAMRRSREGERSEWSEVPRGQIADLLAQFRLTK